MKTTRKELIDFISWLAEKRVNPVIHNPEALVDQYLKSINSQAGNETPTVTDNEAKGELCIHPKTDFFLICPLYATEFCYKKCAYSNAK